MVNTCSTCAENQNSNPKEPMLLPKLLERPWLKLASDLFKLKGSHYLVVVDYYSKWPEVAKLDQLSSQHIVNHLKSLFARYGIPDEIVTDNGPQYSAREFANFAKAYGFKHITSSPQYAQSNGQAEL